MWSQLTIGWQWSRSASTPATVATVTTSAAMLALLVLGALAALPVLAVVAARVARRQGKGLIGPSAVFAAASTILFAGGRHFGNGWPGTGGHRGLVPGALAAFPAAELPPRALAIEIRLATVACVVMAIFLAGSCCRPPTPWP